MYVTFFCQCFLCLSPDDWFTFSFQLHRACLQATLHRPQFSLEPHQHRLLPYPLPPLPPPSNPAYAAYHDPFVQAMHCRQLSMFLSRRRYAAAGAPKGNDDCIRDEDFNSRPPSPNSNSQRASESAQINTGEHGSGRLCFCL
ncbi:hypothetical protein K503DRAFT_807094 [Rhizopogon vinicolor AM-OR11-026]|uniref:Uncharacterized protein n=1 Tax=Rhizopogon vinicolor AM-OR11-026 TaxID=1314800 RepID=A0A1B7MD75_9AGAM|nr:hypothetical protein K503DRAFT_807094 [Rhizopogon vinicolor AM-OR11-026]